MSPFPAFMVGVLPCISAHRMVTERQIPLRVLAQRPSPSDTALRRSNASYALCAGPHPAQSEHRINMCQSEKMAVVGLGSADRIIRCCTVRQFIKSPGAQNLTPIHVILLGVRASLPPQVPDALSSSGLLEPGRPAVGLGVAAAADEVPTRARLLSPRWQLGLLPQGAEGNKR